MTPLPRVEPSSHVFGEVLEPAFLSGVPIGSLVGDQQAALAGQGCFRAGEVKNTYGTGSFVIMNLGAERHASQHGLLTTLALGENLAPVYAFEGSVFIAGAAIQWLRDELKILASAAESEAMASSVPDNGGVYLVPAFVGLGAPYWEPRARGSLVGLTRGSNRNHLVRAALESMAFQTREVVLAMEADSSLSMSELKVDGGAVPNNFLMQFQADLLGCDVLRPAVHETTALGAAFLAGLSTGLWKDVDEVRELCALERRFRPAMPFERREQLWAGWQRAVAQVLAGVS
jgi:glycerol kinase